MNYLILFLLLTSQCSYAVGDTTALNPEMIWVEGGKFQMGRDNGPLNGRPRHMVELSSFYIGKYEITQRFWERVMGENPSFFKDCPDCPVEQISPGEIQIFLQKLNGLTGKHYRLPTEAEWEYASMGGNKSKGYKYSGSNNLDEVAWYKDNANSKTHPVGQKKPNELGIYDMSGNAWEICSDWFNNIYYKKSGLTNPRNDKKAFHKVVRGGSWRSGEDRCRIRARFKDIRDHFGKQNGGFRIVLDQ